MKCFSLGGREVERKCRSLPELGPMWSGPWMPFEAEAERVLGEAGEGAYPKEASRQKQRQEHREHSRGPGLPWA